MYVLSFSVFGSQSVTNLKTSRLKNRPARLKSSSKAVIEISSKMASGSASHGSLAKTVSYLDKIGQCAI